MCGICGVYNYGVDRPVDREVLSAMTAAIAHRGPDDDGFYVSPDGRMGLGFRRLSIVDLAGTLEGYGKLRRMADSDRHVVPGHDPLVMARYPAVSKELEGIAVRLDVPPKDY